VHLWINKNNWAIITLNNLPTINVIEPLNLPCKKINKIVIFADKKSGERGIRTPDTL
jgi:hypothetical protein